MANTYTLIQGYTLASDTSSGVTFSNIPNTYTHLIINMSGRGTRSTYNSDDIKVTINGSTGSYSNIRLYGTNNTSSADGGPGTGQNYLGVIAAAQATANVFGNGEWFFPNYTSSTLKNAYANSGSVDSNNGALYQMGLGSLSAPTNITGAITSIKLEGYDATTGGLLKAGSTIYLYGLKST